LPTIHILFAIVLQSLILHSQNGKILVHYLLQRPTYIRACRLPAKFPSFRISDRRSAFMFVFLL